jgi:hypothetical protein
MSWFTWVIPITLSYIIFVCLVCRFLTGIRSRYKNSNRERWSDEACGQTNSLPQEGRPSMEASNRHCSHAA